MRAVTVNDFATAGMSSMAMAVGMSSHHRAETLREGLSDAECLHLQQVYRKSGGVVSGDQLAHILRRQLTQPISVVARWIVGREVVSYGWRSQTMLPLFQVDLLRATLQPSVTPVILELRDVYPDWRLALWFAEPSAWLDGLTPLHLALKNPRAVLDAARADRCLVQR